MAITFVGSTSGNSISGANITLTLSGVAGIATGDFVYIVSGMRDRAGNEGRIGNALGFTPDVNTTSGNQRCRTAWKNYVSGTDGSCIVEGSANAQDAMAAVALVFRGHQADAPLSTATTTAIGSSTNPNPPSITPLHGGCAIIAMATSLVQDTTPSGTVTNYLPATPVNNNATDNNASTCAGMYRIMTGTVAAEDPGAFSTWTTGAWVAITAALTPRVQVAAAFAGAGGLTADVRVNKRIAAAFAGSGALTADVTIPVAGGTHSVSASFAGAGALVARVATPSEYLRADADDTDGGWTNELDGTLLSPSIDDVLPDDNDYIKSSIDPVADICRVAMSDPTRIATAPLKVRVRYKRTGPGPIDLTMRLQQGTPGFDIAEWVYSDIADEFVTVEETLTSPQIASITDPIDLFIELQADMASPGVTVDANPNASQRSGSGVTSYTYTGLTTTALADCIIVLMNVQNTSASVTSVTWDAAGANQAMTSLGIAQNGAGSGQSHLEVWVLQNPASSGNKNIDVVWTGAAQIMMSAISLIGVNASFGTAFTAASGTLSSVPPSFNVTSASGHIAIGLLANRGSNLSLPTGGTQIFLDNSGAATNGVAQYAPGAATVTFGWTDTGNDFYGYVGVDVAPIGEAAWTPLDLPDLLAWYDASTGVYSDAGSTPAVNNDQVQQWNDLSGNGYHLKQATSGRRPIYKSSDFNTSYPTLQFTASAPSGMLTNTSSVNIGTGNASSGAFVGQLTTATEGDGRGFVYCAPGGNDYDVSGINWMLTHIFNNHDVAAFHNGYKGTQNVTASTPFRYVAVADGTDTKVYVDDGAAVSTADNNSFTNTGCIGVGMLVQNQVQNTGASFDGLISEIVITKSAMSSGDRIRLQTYFKAKWGLS